MQKMKPPSFLPEDSWANPRLTEHRRADDQRRVARLSDLHTVHNGAKVPAPMAPTSRILARSAGRNPPRPVIPTREHVNQKESALLSRGAQPVTHPHRPRNPRHQPGVAPPEVSRTVHNTCYRTFIGFLAHPCPPEGPAQVLGPPVFGVCSRSENPNVELQLCPASPGVLILKATLHPMRRESVSQALHRTDDKRCRPGFTFLLCALCGLTLRPQRFKILLPLPFQDSNCYISLTSIGSISRRK
jgi:hypothetical protein